MFKPLRVDAIAEMVGGEVRGKAEAVLRGLASLDAAGPDDLTFFEPTAKRRRQEFYRMACASPAGAILVPEYDPAITATQIIVKNPLAAIMAAASKLYQSPEPPPGVHPTAVIDSSAEIASGCSIGAYTVIGAGCSIGEQCIIHPHAVLYPGAKVGAHTVVHSGAVIREYVIIGRHCLILNGVVVGGDGFGYMPDPQKGHQRIPHVGTVVLEDGVDVGSNTTIDRGMLGETRIGAGTKIDNLVMIGHNNRLGRGVILCGQVGLAGSCVVGDYAVLGGQVGVADHLSIGPKTRIAAQSGIAGDAEGGIDMMGSPALASREYWRQQAALKRLPDLLRTVHEQNNRIAQLEAKLDGRTGANND